MEDLDGETDRLSRWRSRWDSPRAARAEEFHDAVDVRPGGELEVELAAATLVIETHDAPRVEVEASANQWLGRAGTSSCRQRRRERQARAARTG